MIGREPRGRPLALYTSGQTPKVKGLQSAYMSALFSTFDAKSSTSQQEFGCSKNGNPNSSREANLFSIKYSKSDKRTPIIYFIGLMSSPLERSLGFDLSAWLAKSEEALSFNSFRHIIIDDM